MLARDDARSVAWGAFNEQRERELERYRLVLTALVHVGRLTIGDERRFAVPDLQITVLDRRTNPSRPLPALPR